MTRPAPVRPACWAYAHAAAISSVAADHRLPLARGRHHGLDDARRAERGDGVVDLVLGVAEAVVAGLEAELLGDEPPDALAVHRQPRGARRRHDVQPVAFELEKHVRGDRLELGDDEQLRARPRALGLEHALQRGGVGHVDHRVALGHLHRGRVGVAVDRDHLAAEPHRLDRHLTTELAAAQQDDAHGGVGQRRARGEGHDRAAYALGVRLDARNGGFPRILGCRRSRPVLAVRRLRRHVVGQAPQAPGRASGQAGGAARARPCQARGTGRSAAACRSDVVSRGGDARGRARCGAVGIGTAWLVVAAAARSVHRRQRRRDRCSAGVRGGATRPPGRAGGAARTRRGVRERARTARVGTRQRPAEGRTTQPRVGSGDPRGAGTAHRRRARGRLRRRRHDLRRGDP